MTVHAYRIMQKKHLNDAFNGEGAETHGGRWNSIGTKVIYTAGSVSLATLEVLVHTEDYSVIFNRYSIIPVQFDQTLFKSVEIKSLPRKWNSPMVISETQIIGDRWAAIQESAVLEVPSAVTEGESNYIINPLHQDFPEIKIGTPFDFSPDTRLADKH